MTMHLLTTQENSQYVTREWILITESNSFGDQLITLNKYDFDGNIVKTIKDMNYEGNWETVEQIKNRYGIGEAETIQDDVFEIDVADMSVIYNMKNALRS